MTYRQQNGPFQQADDLMNVSGIGPGRFAKLRALVVAP
jgi:DNA uptake protein ComE-like DNA-binding protein